MPRTKTATIWIRCLALVLGMAPAVVGGPSWGRTLDLEFRPPDLDIDPICVARPPDEETTAFWAAWDAEALPDWETAMVRRDLSRLMHLDPARWFDTAMAMIERLEERDPRFLGQNALLARIAVMEAAGRFEALMRSRMVPQLADYGDTLSAGSRTALARFYRDGIGVPRDVDEADALLISAGFAGNADALLTLSSMALAGEAPAAWDVPLELAVTMAFGALVGELNTTICDRTARIAREYHSGEIVTKSPQLAHDWFRFTADLGDAHAAWKVVEYHLEAEGFRKSNDLLLKYLTQAADAGLPYAEIELGRQYESGALLPRDLDRALELYERAAADGARAGLTRVALFLELHAAEFPDKRPRRLEALRALVSLADAPGWAFTRLAAAVIEDKGRWAGAAEARALLEEAVAREDLDGTVSLAELLLAQPGDPSDFDRAVDLLSRAVSVSGGVTPLKVLSSAFACRAQDAPRLQEAAYWAGLERETDTANLDLPGERLVSLSPRREPLVYAVLQSHALYGRPSALAGWLRLLQRDPAASDEMRSFWLEHSKRYGLVSDALMKTQAELGGRRDERLQEARRLRARYAKSGPSTALKLAEMLLDSPPGDTPLRRMEEQAEALALLEAPAAEGMGRAMQLMADHARSAVERRDIFERYREVIAADGDFEALLFAVPFLAPGEQRARYLARAKGIMTCDYKSAISMANVSILIGERTIAEHWIEVSRHLLDDNAWAMTDLAKTVLALGRPGARPEAVELLTRARAMGDETASRTLFDLAIASGTDSYDPQQAAAMLTEASAQAEYALLTSFLSRLRRADERVRVPIAQLLDMADLYRRAAESGDLISMRSYGLFLQDTAASPAQLSEASDWLRRAAEGGDTAAMSEYGEALAFGIGVTPDPERAIHWLERAAAQGNQRAAGITRLVRMSGGG
ncbi:tetratricopeptide repeat protein [Alloyangia pacifica]|uniref:tetratricopeptide repeat protein n=1 Tax=Alloyangia pacifica TaxID=311180 RepID=UPI001CFEB8CA|nr:hypothetical protein [Alloyangia pacifica]